MKKETRINRKHKDRLFLRIFQDKSALLELYNALNHTSYTNFEDLEITTIEDVLYMRMKNDVSFLFGEELRLYEHQSTCNPNMPLRGLLYLCQVYQGLIESSRWNLFSSRLISLPTPSYFVFYNGTSDEPDRQELYLSDAFSKKSDIAFSLEFKATVINVNLGHNRDLMERCHELNDYAHLIHYIRKSMEVERDFETAVNSAVEQCIHEDILADFLRKHRGEVLGLILSEYNEQAFLESERIVWKEDGYREGHLEGLIKGMINTCQSLDLSKEETLSRIKQALSSDSENAAQFLDKYWK